MAWGNVSGIDPERTVMAIRPSGVDYEHRSPDDAVVVSFYDGSVVTAPSTYDETEDNTSDHGGMALAEEEANEDIHESKSSDKREDVEDSSHSEPTVEDDCIQIAANMERIQHAWSDLLDQLRQYSEIIPRFPSTTQGFTG